jgi:TRAP-type transport system small permease protein
MARKIERALFSGANKITDFFTAITDYVLLLLLLWICVTVVMRYIFHNPIDFSTELAVFVSIFIFYIPLASAFRKGILPVITVVSDRVPPKVQNVILAFSAACFFVTSAYLTYILFKNMIGTFAYDTKIDMMEWVAAGWIRVPMIIGMLLLAVVTLCHLIHHIDNLIHGNEPDNEPTLT